MSLTSLKRRVALSGALVVTCLLFTILTNFFYLQGILDSLIPPSLETLNNRMLHRWQESGINSYHIEVEVRWAMWHAQTYLITVRDGQVVAFDSYCTPSVSENGGCVVEPYTAEDYTVNSLFSRILNVVSDRPDAVFAEFDSIYPIPTYVRIDYPEMFDEQVTFQVVAFEPLSL